MQSIHESGNKGRVLVTALALLVGLASGAFAGAGNVFADTFQGSIWSLTYGGSPLADSDLSTETFRITLDVDTTGYTGGGSFLDQVALKVSSSLVGASLFAAPGGTSSWLLSAGGIDASGCSGSGSGFECANSALILNGGKGVPVGFDYAWVFDLTMPNGALFTGFEESTVKGRFVDFSGNKVGALVSENVTLIPEPEIYAMMVAGLGLMAFVARRRRQQAAAG